MRTLIFVVRAALAALPLLALSLVSCGGGSPPPAAAPTPTAASPADATQGGTALIPGGSAGSKKADKASNPAWSSCHSSFKPAAADLGAEVGKMAQGCAGVTKMHVVGETFKGHQSASNPPQSFKLKAQAKHCYRAYAAAAGGIADLDLLIKDSEGAVAGEDSTDDPTPVVIEDGAVCFKADDDASVVVSVGSGEGDYAVQVWSD